MAFPNVRLASRPLHFLYLCDCSGSMEAQGKIESLNQAIRQSLPGMAAVARENPEARVLVRAVAFADTARWHIATPTPVEELRWPDLRAGGVTALGAALRLVAAELRSPPMEARALPPVLVLVSDGQPTDDFEAGLAELLAQPWARRAVRLAIAMGADADGEVLQRFIGPHAERRPLQAGNATTLARYIQWASTAVVGAASSGASRLAGIAETPSGEPAAAAGRRLDPDPVPLPDLPPTELDPFEDPEPLKW